MNTDLFNECALEVLYLLFYVYMYKYTFNYFKIIRKMWDQLMEMNKNCLNEKCFE